MYNVRIYLTNVMYNYIIVMLCITEKVKIMLILPNEINKLLLISGERVTNRGKKYFEQDRVKIKNVNIDNDSKFCIEDIVQGTYAYETKVTKELNKIEYSCSCQAEKPTPCKHVIAALFDIYTNEEKYREFKSNSYGIKLGYIKENEEKNIDLMQRYKKRSANKLINYYENLELEELSKSEEKIKLIPKIEISGFKFSEMYITLKIGRSKTYVIKDIYEFASDLNTRQNVRFGKDLEVRLEFEKFQNARFVKFVFSKAQEYTAFASMDHYFSIDSRLKNKLRLSYGAIDEFFDIFKNEIVDITDYYYSKSIQLVEEDPNLDLEICIEDNKLILKDINKDDYYIYYGEQYNYIIYKDKMYRCSGDFSKKVLPVLKNFITDYNNEIVLYDEITSFSEYVVPNISKYINIEDKDKILEKYKPEKLGVKVFLDEDDGGDIIANVKFCYGNTEFNPFLDKDSGYSNRNFVKEQRAIDLIFNNKFILNQSSLNLVMSKDEDIYNFMKNGINEFMEKFEVLATEKFKLKNVISPKSVTMGLRIKNDLLEIDLEKIDFSPSELESIFKSYSLKKKFHRLKNGNFIDLENSSIKTLTNIIENTGVKFNLSNNSKFTVPKYRSVYLNNLLDSSEDINVKKEASFKELVRKISDASNLDFSLPSSMQNILREYQKTGYNWLKTLDMLGFGGILADDMGLGKTLQIISIFEDEKVHDSLTSIVVCPSSLYLNWQKEINKFAPDLNVLVISGGAIYRKQLIKEINKYDIVITSYDLLKRDIDEYSDYNFRYIIADEAQYIKNNNTKNAKALKMLKGKTKFALTGTPIENSLAEVWSIFDFCMPGFLYSYSKFKEKFEKSIVRDNDLKRQETLKNMVEPFILRRIKKDVLKELPEKTETKMYSIMSEKQERIYNAYLYKIKQQVKTEIEENGIEKSKMKILALITRLRQICCHPSLFLEDYDGESSKLEQCIQLLEDACSSGHKILVFSQFTSMFELIKKELEKRNIKYYELTGQTKVDTRVELVDKFNKESTVPVFLISLKAGGTGLNLTSADMVIHFDPWWNLSVQNQATDRAYRIGQKNNVQVFSLITENTIEEKVVKLQEAKKNLSDNIITSSETFISSLSNDEIMKLFE